MPLDLARLPAHFHEITTGDGSPTLSFQSDAGPEAMHHSGGALSETKYVYAPVLEANFARTRGSVIVSLGTGLAYNEILAATYARKYPEHLFALHTYESDEFLRASFALWLQGRDDLALAPLYARICAGFEIDVQDVREIFTGASAKANLIFEERLARPEDLPQGVTGFLWDAFSRKTSPELWDEEFLVACFSRADREFCELSTYARNGNLKRALARAGFQVVDQKGFANKRSSTRASFSPGRS